MQKANSTPIRVTALIVGLITNALGNGLTISTNMGAAPWTAAEVNLAKLFNLSVGMTMFIAGVLVAIVNQLLIHQWDKWRFIGETIYIACFSYFIDLFLALYDWIGIPHLNIIWRTILCFAGICIFCAAISIYQRANIVMHPNDDTTNILRFLYLKGHVGWAQLVNFLIPMAVILLVFLVTRHIYSVNIGTLLCILCNGPLIGIADQHVWLSLHHNFRAKANR
ncbi:YitT family protein [Limosilactobacillus sp.]|uniref:YczE/YyaS/YitT family protein n=1 Tax=Limosilactobacillus sp. TaxID=2773925 RepID=UPI00345EAB7A